ncbi:MAG: divergent polysaccharide deacetylase family protein [Hyphomonadaceae bacterium]|nr:divergent polysaccharide deacetylase family protein [Hyphomonadaceae bacterium]
MASSRHAEPSALRTGISQLALAVLAFGMLGGGAVGGVMLFGDSDAGGPRVELALFTDQNGPPPLLKTRTRMTNGLDAEAELEPSLPGVEYEDGALPEGAGDGEAANITITEIESNAPVAAASPLVKAPIAGFFERTPAGDLPKISADGRTPAEAYARPFAAQAGTPKVSLIVGGLGLNQKHTLDAINELPPEVTLSFVPYANDLQTWINRARAAGHEVLLELPMEAYDYPNVDTGPHTLLTSAKPEENVRRLSLLMGKASGYFGVTNYQGAKFATDARAAAPVLKALKQRGLVFMHDGAAARSVLPQTAQEAGLNFSIADRIVDAEPSADSIDRELLQLEALAIQNGKAVGVGYAYPVTIEQFRIWTSGLKAKGYQLAPASTAAGVTARGTRPAP